MADIDKETTRSFFDNINYKVVDDLRVTLRQGSKVSIASACFSIYAFNELREQLEGLDELRFIFTAPSFLKERESKQRREFYIPRIDRERTLYGSQFEVRLRNQLSTIEVEEGNTLEEQIHYDEKRAKLLKRIENLELKSRTERQTRRRLEMFEELQKLRDML